MTFPQLDRVIALSGRLQPILAVGGDQTAWQQAILQLQHGLGITAADTVCTEDVPTIEALRSVLQRIQLKPLHGSRTLVVFFSLDRWSPELATTLLKTIEEPPSHAVMLLCAGTGSALLATIKSRVSMVRLGEAAPTERDAVVRVDSGSLRDAFAATQRLAEREESAVETVGGWLMQAQSPAARRSLLALASSIGTTPVNKRLALDVAALMQRQER